MNAKAYPLKYVKASHSVKDINEPGYARVFKETKTIVITLFLKL